MSISVRGVSKRFGAFTAVNNVDLEVPRGELVALLGPSGSGKTTLLRIIAGMEQPDSGTVVLNGEEATDKGLRDRYVGFVFQHYALFRHMTVFDNVAFGLSVRPRRTRPSRKEIKDRVMALIRLVQLERFATQYPNQLSGGQRQRVALARALAVEPQVLLLDEPFGALDARVRKDLRRWLRELHEKIQLTSVFVTHDQEEALEVADRVAILNEGRVEQTGTPEEVYHSPSNSFVTHFLGDVNLFHGRFQDGKAVIVGMPGREGQTIRGADGQEAEVFVRPHLIDVLLAPPEGDCLKCTVTHVNPAGPYVKAELVSEWGGPLQVVLTQERYRELSLARDMTVFVVPREMRAFPARQG